MWQAYVRFSSGSTTRADVAEDEEDARKALEDAMNQLKSNGIATVGPSLVVLGDESGGLLLSDATGKVRTALARQVDGASSLSFMDEANKTRADMGIRSVLNDKGRQAFTAQEYGRAEQRFRDATAALPDDAPAYFLLAQARFAPLAPYVKFTLIEKHPARSPVSQPGSLRHALARYSSTNPPSYKNATRSLAVIAAWACSPESSSFAPTGRKPCVKRRRPCTRHSHAG